MEFIKAIQLYKSHGSQTLFGAVDFRILEGESIALIGPNGAGKSSLIRLLMQQDLPEQGNLIIRKGLRIGYVEQTALYEPGQSIRDFLLQEILPVEQRLRELEEAMASAGDAEMEKLLLEYQQKTEQLELLGGYDAEDKGEATLRALGMENDLDQELSTLSGGELSLLSFARALLARPDLLILDEPGNHLDYLGLAWLEQFLAGYPGTLLIVSHNRYMLDKVSRHLWYLADGNFTQFKGKYSDFIRSHRQEAILQQQDHKNREKRMAQLRKKIAQLQSIAQAQYNPPARVMAQLGAAQRKLAQEEQADPGKPELNIDSISVDLQDQQKGGEIAIQINGYSKSFDGNQVLRDIRLEIHKNEKVALIGPNGCGKTTLLKALIEEADWDDPVLRIGPGYKVGYLRQESSLAENPRSIVEEVREWGPLSVDGAFNLIKPFLFRYEELDKKVSVLSGGEKKRLELARLIYQKADLLILDEPTNHMDILSREAIEEALQQFQGTLLVVSHDRYFLDSLVHRVVDLEGGVLQNYPGNFSDFFKSKYPRLPRVSSRFQDRGKMRQTTDASSDSRTERLEQRISDLEAEKSARERELNQAYLEQNHKAGKELVRDLEKIQHQLDLLYREWEESSD